MRTPKIYRGFNEGSMGIFHLRGDAQACFYSLHQRYSYSCVEADGLWLVCAPDVNVLEAVSGIYIKFYCQLTCCAHGREESHGTVHSEMVRRLWVEVWSRVVSEI